MQVKALMAATLLFLLPGASHATHLMYMPFETASSLAVFERAPSLASQLPQGSGCTQRM